MTDKLKALTKDTAVPVSMAFLVAMLLGVWTLAFRVHSWEVRLSSMEKAITSRWSYYMERDAWAEFLKLNPTVKVPDVQKIKSFYRLP